MATKEHSHSILHSSPSPPANMALHNDRVGHLLGSGGTGDVYAAYIDGRPCALKIVVMK